MELKSNRYRNIHFTDKIIGKAFCLVMVFIFMFHHVQIKAQLRNDDCKKLILDYYNNQKNQLQNSQGKSLELSMNYKSYIRPDKASGSMIVNTSSSDVYMLLTKEKMYYKNEYAEFYQDPKDRIIIINNERLIIWQDNADKLNADLTNPGTGFLDSLIIESSVKSCTVAPASYGEHVKKISIELPVKYQKLSKAQELIYYFDTIAKRMHSIEIIYLPQHQVQKQIIKYLKEGFIQTKKLQSAVKYQIVDRYGKLNKKYAAYRIEDNRSSKR